MRSNPPVHGRTSLISHNGQALFKGIESPFAAVRYHSLIVSPVNLPDELTVTATSDAIIMGLNHKHRPIWTVQFHPESICTNHGQTIIDNFCSLVEEHWSNEILSRPSCLKLPSALDSISVIPSPLVPSTSRKASNYHAIIKQLDLIVDSEVVFDSLYSNDSNTFWLDSAKVENGLSRYSFMGDIRGPEGYFF